MIRALLVADSGDVMASVTDALWQIPVVDIVGHASGRSHVSGIVEANRPDVVVVDQMSWTGMALARIGEIRESHPSIGIVALFDRTGGDWIADGLHAGADAVVPRDLRPADLRAVLSEVVALDTHLHARSAA
jgi:DNA-binding NarL/FixJ family response regulator